ncbi:MAG: hypothetical protein LIO70_01110 [Clostridiales bacterium]|nr:hypothetical protein [Clostridiales bacterium]
MYTITLADGIAVEFAGLNGTNYIVKGASPLDTSIFTDENLASGTVTDEDGVETPFTNWSFIQQQKQLNGDYYICFRQKSKEELDAEAKAARETEVQEALVELYELLLGGDE